MERDSRKELLEQIRRKLHEVVNAQTDFQKRTSEMLGSLMALHVFDPAEVDMDEKAALLNRITLKLVDVKKNKHDEAKADADRRELLELYKLFLK